MTPTQTNNMVNNPIRNKLPFCVASVSFGNSLMSADSIAPSTITPIMAISMLIGFIQTALYLKVIPINSVVKGVNKLSYSLINNRGIAYEIRNQEGIG